MREKTWEAQVLKEQGQRVRLTADLKSEKGKVLAKAGTCGYGKQEALNVQLWNVNFDYQWFCRTVSADIVEIV